MIKIPKITVIQREIKRKEDSHFLVTLKFSDGTFKSSFGLDRDYVDETIYTGEVPSIFRILPKVDLKFLRYYQIFRSQTIPKSVTSHDIYSKLPEQ